MSAASISTIQASVAERFGVTLQDLLSPSQRRGISRARHVAMRLARQEGYSLRMIGYWFRRDHTTVRQALERMELTGDAV
jgi:chromosomal replication initiation ATPase DnaA